ncbi:MAG: BMP family lipoprotein [Mycoplasmatales bacterium]
MKKIMMMLMLVTVVLSGCVQKSGGETTGTTTNPNKGACEKYDKKIGMVTDKGGVNDKSFNQGTWEGIEKYCAENKVGAEVIESKEDSQYEPNIKTMADKYDVIVAAGFLFQNTIGKLAPQYPDKNFIFIDGVPTDAKDNQLEYKNVTSYLFNEGEAGYLVGYVAAKMSDTKNVGFIGGLELPAVQKFGWGYLQGVAAADPTTTVQYNYSGSFDDAALGKTTATTMFKGGASTVFTAAGGVGAGVIQATIDEVTAGNKKWAIGVDKDQYEDGKMADGKSVILTSAVKKVGTAAFDGLTDHFSNKFPGGVVTLGFDEGAVGFPEANPNVDQALIDEALASLKGADVKIKDAAEVKAAIKDLKVTGKY